MKQKKWLGIVMATVMVVGMVTACAKHTDGGSTDGGSVYYLNFKPEVAQQWEDIAKEYTQETGIDVKIVTAASGTYEQQLKSEMAKKSPPTLFQVNGPVGLQSWKQYCLDLKDTKLNSWLRDSSMALKDGDQVLAVPYVVEGYGIIYNEDIMDQYFALDGAKATKIEEIDTFDKLKEVAEDMTAQKDKLGIDGVFASTSFAPGEDWRWQTHLFNLPLYYEYKDAGVSSEAEITFKYNPQYQNIFDLYINNSTTAATMLGSKSVSDSMSEFALGKAAMVQNGDWAWSQISGVSGNVVKEDKIKMLPIYIGVSGEESQGLCTGTENFFCINSQASEADQQATMNFVEWVFSSDKGKAAVTNDLGFISPFNTFTDKDNPTDPLAQQIISYMDNSKLTSVPWDFTTIPSQTFKDDLGASLLSYAQGQMKWDDLVSKTIDDWKTEYAASGGAGTE